MSQCADNYHFDITAWQGHYTNGRDMLEECLRIAFAEYDNGATYWSSHNKKRLVLYWRDPSGVNGAVAFMGATGPGVVTPLVRQWLSNAEYPKEPNHDGSNSKGWRIFNEDWAQVDGEPAAICAIEPAWLMHGK